MRDNLRPGPRIISGAADPLRLVPEPWTEAALCPQTDHEAFFPEQGGNTKSAKAICHRCPVESECLVYALKHREPYGIWGGMSPRQRRALERDIHGEAS